MYEMTCSIRRTYISFHVDDLSIPVLAVMKHHHLYSIMQNTPLKLKKFKFYKSYFHPIISQRINVIISVGLFYRLVD